jgi:hypothetical protein
MDPILSRYGAAVRNFLIFAIFTILFGYFTIQKITSFDIITRLCQLPVKNSFLCCMCTALLGLQQKL